MKRIVERCCGLDVHKTSVTACVKVPAESGGSYHQEVERFATTTRGLLKLRDWLGSFKVELVAWKQQESIGSPSTICLKATSSCGS